MLEDPSPKWCRSSPSWKAGDVSCLFEIVLSLVKFQIKLGNDPPERGAGPLLVGQCLGGNGKPVLQLGVTFCEFLHRGGSAVLCLGSCLEFFDEVLVVAVGDIAPEAGLAQQL
ncbi:hypothetical protein BGM19_02460 [Streptomyces agglomeratus]|nr:hypothetical protein BGM19_02460 [Streptomyces agglomeratus]